MADIIGDFAKKETNEKIIKLKNECEEILSLDNIMKVEEKGYPVTTYNLTVEDNHTLFVSDEGVLTHNMNNVLTGCNFATEVSEKLSKGVSKAEINTAEGIKNIINRKGYSVDEFAQLLHPDRVLTNNTAFKTTTGVDGISQSVGLPDRFYGTIEYKVNDVSKVSIPDWKANPEDYPYTGKGFTGSSDIVLPEYFQENRKFMNGDIFSIIDSCSGEVISKFKYNIKFGWINFN